MRFRWMLAGAAAGALLLALAGCGEDDNDRLVAESNEAVARAVRESAEAALAERKANLPTAEDFETIAENARNAVASAREQSIWAWREAMKRANEASSLARELLEGEVERGSEAWNRAMEEVLAARGSAREAYDAAREHPAEELELLQRMAEDAYIEARRAWADLGLEPLPEAPLVFEDGFDGETARAAGPAQPDSDSG